LITADEGAGECITGIGIIPQQRAGEAGEDVVIVGLGLSTRGGRCRAETLYGRQECSEDDREHGGHGR
jgi:hypothetical protein